MDKIKLMNYQNDRVYWVPFVLCRQGITSGDKRNLFLLASSLGTKEKREKRKESLVNNTLYRHPYCE
jgi:hypothetical protein